MMKYEVPSVEILEFEVKDIVTASVPPSELTDGGTGGADKSGWSEWF